MSEPVIRAAVEADLPRLVEVEAAAGQMFLEVGMPAIADDVPEIEELRESLRVDRLWVLELDGAIAGYICADIVDGNAYIGQVSVDPAYARRGLGRLLIRYVEAWGRAQGCPATTLTTFRNVPWNAPYYRRLGYEELAADQIGPGLAQIIGFQAALPVLGGWPRCALTRTALDASE